MAKQEMVKESQKEVRMEEERRGSKERNARCGRIGK